MQSRWNVLEILAKTLHDRDGVARHGVIARPCSQADQSEHREDDQSAWAATRHDLLESILPLPDQMLNIGARFGPAIPGAATAVLRWHWNVLSCVRLRSRSV